MTTAGTILEERIAPLVNICRVGRPTWQQEVDAATKCTTLHTHTRALRTLSQKLLLC